MCEGGDADIDDGSAVPGQTTIELGATAPVHYEVVAGATGSPASLPDSFGFDDGAHTDVAPTLQTASQQPDSFGFDDGAYTDVAPTATPQTGAASPNFEDPYGTAMVLGCANPGYAELPAAQQRRNTLTSVQLAEGELYATVGPALTNDGGNEEGMYAELPDVDTHGEAAAVHSN